ncbi:MAG: hypothetical protein ACR5LG_15830 [Sodalis sp. (in: enterobacteria)]|uniref:hypothetical protein n=1 Tax=Sodalis sp. (in: enterobacteria) TaxID=1898979 RepID=UPI003F3985EE
MRYDMQLPKNNIVWRANVENVTNENYWVSASDGYLTQGDPRSLKLSMTVNFQAPPGAYRPGVQTHRQAGAFFCLNNGEATAAIFNG